MADANTVAIITACVGIAGLVLTVSWNIYNKTTNTHKEDLARLQNKHREDVDKLNEKIDTNTAHCVNKQRDLQMNIDQLEKDHVNHKLDSVSRRDVNLLMDEKIKPLKDSIDDMKSDQKDIRHDQKLTNELVSKVIASLARIEGSLSIPTRRSED